jgi:uncharacterized protein (DUF697 family)
LKTKFGDYVLNIPIPLVEHLGAFKEAIRSLLTDDFSALDEISRKAKAAEARNLSAKAAALIAPMPIPFADIWTITPIQMAMVRAIGNVYGYKLDQKAVKELLIVVGGGWLGQQICLALFKIGMPGAGGFGGAAFVFVWTHAMGLAAETYFSSGKTATKQQLQAALKQGFEEAKKVYQKWKPVGQPKTSI